MVDRPVLIPILLCTLVFGCTRSDTDGEQPRLSFWRGTSKSGDIVATVAPERGSPQLNKFQAWTLQLRRKDGAAVYPARIGINGGMPEHGHGLPTQPEVTDYLGDGKYRIEGLKFNMMGTWALLFVVDTPRGKDRVQVDVVLEW
ncbi:MAG: FixH family protein [Myxococcota bacterium]